MKEEQTYAKERERAKLCSGQSIAYCRTTEAIFREDGVVLHGCPVKLQRQMDENDGVPHYWLYPAFSPRRRPYPYSTTLENARTARVIGDSRGAR